MNSNPIVEKQQQEEQERRAKAAYRYPITIVCVYLDSDNNDFPIILETRDYCNKNNLIFTARQYDHEKNADDLGVKRLPAFHVYYKKGWQNTEYYDTNPIHKIQTVVWAYQDEMRAKERARIRRQERWDSFVEGMKSTFSLDRFKTKPALDLDASLSHERDSTVCKEARSTN
jgi:hypothetical protein